MEAKSHGPRLWVNKEPSASKVKEHTWFLTQRHNQNTDEYDQVKNMIKSVKERKSLQRDEKQKNDLKIMYKVNAKDDQMM